jgi:hypothetical protein
MVVACVALVVALGGVGYAAGVLPRNSVGTAQLKQRAVSGAKLKASSVTGAKVKDGSLLPADFSAGQLPVGPKGPKGDPGVAGPAGPEGDPGVTGSPGLSEVEYVQATATNSSQGRVTFAFPSCPDDKRAIAAGGQVSTAVADDGKVMLTNASLLSNSTAEVVAEEVAGQSPGTWTLIGHVVCAKVQ